MYKFRVILDAKNDVIREIAIARDFTLEELHQTIVNAYGFDGLEMASFYQTDNDWNQGDEIPLFNMNDQIGGLTQMRDYKIDFMFTKSNSKMIYVYDFLNLWMFFVEFTGKYDKTEDKSTPLLLLSIGELPEKAPEKKFEIEERDDDDFDIFDGDDSFFQ
jgi:hypothetical protein